MIAFLLILLVLISGASFYFYYGMRADLNGINSSLSADQSLISSLQSQVKSLSANESLIYSLLSQMKPQNPGSTQSSTVSVTSVDMPAAIRVASTAPAFTAVCGTVPSGSYGTIALSNSGSNSTGATEISLTYGGATSAYPLGGPSCDVPAHGSLQVYVTRIPESASPGQAFTGSITLASGAEVPFTGTFA